VRTVSRVLRVCCAPALILDCPGLASSGGSYRCVRSVTNAAGWLTTGPGGPDTVAGLVAHGVRADAMGWGSLTDLLPGWCAGRHPVADLWRS